jgi:hypothetical protein
MPQSATRAGDDRRPRRSGEDAEGAAESPSARDRLCAAVSTLPSLPQVAKVSAVSHIPRFYRG